MIVNLLVVQITKSSSLLEVVVGKKPQPQNPANSRYTTNRSLRQIFFKKPAFLFKMYIHDIRSTGSWHSVKTIRLWLTGTPIKLWGSGIFLSPKSMLAWESDAAHASLSFPQGKSCQDQDPQFQKGAPESRTHFTFLPFLVPLRILALLLVVCGMTSRKRWMPSPTQPIDHHFITVF